MKRALGSGLEAVAAVLLGVSLAATYAGALRFEIFGVLLSVRNLARPLGATAIVLLLRALLLPRSSGIRARLIAASVRIAAGTLIVAGTVGWVRYLSPVVGGADSYGYVSASQRLLSGTLVQPEPLASVLPFPSAIAAACPLGYVPSARTPNASVPAYPLGLPALMTAVTFAFGPRAPFYVAPVMGLLVLAAAYVTAVAWYSDRLVALLACALLAFHPVLFAYSLQPMSDTPAAAWLLIAVAALSTTRQRPALAGIAAAAAFITRPALLPAAGMLVLLPLLRDGWRGWSHSLVYLMPVAAGASGQAALQWHLYGSVRSSGYGNLAALFSLDSLQANAWIFGYWGFLAHGTIWVIAFALGLMHSKRLPRLVLVLVGLGIAVPYLLYRPYDHWETLRFLLPALILATIVAAAGIVFVARRAGEAVGSGVAVAIVGVLAGTWLSWLASHNVLTMAEHEARHRLAGEMVARVTPPDAVILALQHSGSLRYYADRDTVNWDQIPAGSFQAAVRAVQKLGRPVYLILDSDAERRMFEAKHGNVIEAAGWWPNGQRRSMQLYQAPP